MNNINESSSDSYFVGTINNSSKNDLTWLVDLSINGIIMECQLDTGAQVNIMSKNNFLKLKINEFIINKQLTTKLVSIHAKVIPAIGTCKLKCYYKDNFEFILFYIVDFDCITILGLPTCNKFNLIKRINCVSDTNKSIINKYNDIFEGLGSLPIKCHIYIDHSV